MPLCTPPRDFRPPAGGAYFFFASLLPIIASPIFSPKASPSKKPVSVIPAAAANFYKAAFSFGVTRMFMDSVRSFGFTFMFLPPNTFITQLHDVMTSYHGVFTVSRTFLYSKQCYALGIEIRGLLPLHELRCAAIAVLGIAGAYQHDNLCNKAALLTRAALRLRRKSLPRFLEQPTASQEKTGCPIWASCQR